MKNTPIETEYRSLPFWSWNDRLRTEKTEEQITQMYENGIGGFFIHSRGGLQTPYMGDEWYENIDRAIECADRLGMEPWIYDEDGWPSGFGGGIVTGMGDEYRQKWLCMEKGNLDCETTVCHAGGYHFFYEVNPYYVDVLEPKVCRVFLERIYKVYIERYRGRVRGFFNDEPQVSRYRVPWSAVLPDEYRNAYGDELLPRLPELFFSVGDYKETRFRFWKLVTDLFSKNFMKPLSDFCHAASMKVTGHLLGEESLASQILPGGALMPQYEYYDMPGMDWLGREIRDCLTPMQVSSVAHQLGKKQILSETFAGCGHNLGFDRMKEIFEWQMVHGITRLCQHLESYSLRGLRKRHHPPALSYQQPWWKDYRIFNDAMARIGKLLSEGEVRFRVLLIHPQSTAWELFDGSETPELKELNRVLLEEMRTLEGKHIPYHLGDETLMSRHAHVEGKTLVIGTQRYTQVILLPGCRLFESTEALLRTYRENGGIVTRACSIADNPLIDNPEITFTEREYPGGKKIYYFVNSSGKPQEAVITQGGSQMDPVTGEWSPFCGKHHFPVGGSLILMDDGTGQIPMPEAEAEKKFPLGGKWKVASAALNTLTLDRCDYWFDGTPVEKDGYILDVMQNALRLEHPVRVRMCFHVKVDEVPEELYLVTETPEYYRLSVNGVPLEKKDCGFFADESFRKLDLSGALRPGENTIEAETDFFQSEEVYRRAEQASAFEVEKNRFTCDREIEAFYLLGKFGVACDGQWTEVPGNASVTPGKFRITRLPEEVLPEHLERQGFPFFAGSVTLTKEFTYDEGNGSWLDFEKEGCNVVRVRINGRECPPVVWAPYRVGLTPYLCKGKNVIEVTLTDNLRNLLGPHHAGQEPILVRPGYFQRCKSFWMRDPVWDEQYCFAHFGIHSVNIIFTETNKIQVPVNPNPKQQKIRKD